MTSKVFMNKRTKGMLVVLALFVCTSFCLGDPPIEIDRPVRMWYLGDYYCRIAGNGDPKKGSENYGHVPDNNVWNAPKDKILIINPGAEVGDAYGAYMDAASLKGKNFRFRLMTNNKLIVNGGDFTKGNNIAGAYASADDDGIGLVNIASNTVTINGGKGIKDVFGGYTRTGTVSSNTVIISNNVTIKKGVLGGLSGNGNAIKNIVDISGGAKIIVVGGGDGVYGGLSGNGNVKENEVKLTNVSVSLSVYGGCVGNNGDAIDNKVEINGGNVGCHVLGGYIGKNGTAILNTVNLTDVDVRNNVYGARIGTEEYNIFEGNGLASSNTVTIKGGIIGTELGKDVEEERRNVYGGYIVNNGTATLNTVKLTDVDVRNNVYGAWIGVRYVVGGNGLASSNTVTIIRGTVKQNVYGGYVKNGTATLNTVNLTNVTVRGDVYGAWIGVKYVVENGLASNNIVTITGGKVEGDVLGGRIMRCKGTATGNTVKLTDVDVTHDVYGARIGTSKRVVDEERAKAKAERTKALEAAKEAGRVMNSIGYKRIIIDAAFKAEKAKVCGMVVNRDETEEVKLEEVFGAKKVFGMVVNRDETEEVKKAKLEEVFGAKMEADYEAAKDKLVGEQEAKLVDFRTKHKTVAEYDKLLEELQTEYFKFSKSFLEGIVERLQAYEDKAYKLASGNIVTITGGRFGRDVYGAKIESDGLASSNTVTIDGGKIEGKVIGGYVGGNGKAINNTINITGRPEFSTETILCGGICGGTTTANAVTNDAFTGNTLDIKTKEVVVKGISNFEGYKFTLNKDVKSGDTILTATSGGCSWDVVMDTYTPECVVDLTSSNINLFVEGIMNKGDYYVLMKSPKKFKDNGSHKPYKRFDSDNVGLVKYEWELELTPNGQDLIAKLIVKEVIEEKTKPLLEGYGAGIACINNGMDCVLSKMEESESLVGGNEGEIGAFYGIAANKSRYNTGSHVDMVGMSMMVGAGKVVEVGGKELTAGAFVEYGTGDSDIYFQKHSKGTSKYVGGGALGRYNLRGDENSMAKMYAEVVLRAGKVNNSFKGNEVKNEITGEEPKYEVEPMYEGAEAGVGYKRKVNEKIDLDWSLKYVFGCQNKKDVTLPDDGNIVKFESVISNRIRAGVRGNCTGIGKVKPYAGMWYERELSGKVKAIVRNGRDDLNVAKSPSFEGGILMIEAGVSSKVWKLDVDISGQKYIGVREGLGGMLKIKYAFGKNTYDKP